MYYLVTGTNGSGKTLNTLNWVRKKQLDEGRPVAYANIDLKPEIVEKFGWKEFDPKEWQKLEPGTIIIIDECHKYFPVRPSGQRPPQYVEALAEHRKQGLDFFLITQHPRNMDAFIRKLIASPSWHRHLKRFAGRDFVNVLEFNYCEEVPEKPGSGSSAQAKMERFPKEVYDWYNSAEIHTVKKTMPRKVYVLGACLILVPALFIATFFLIPKVDQTPEKKEKQENIQSQAFTPLVSQKVSESDYFKSFIPRVPDFPHTAPRYDEITKPVTAPYPVGCLNMNNKCTCYTQQGTKMDISKQVCLNIIKDGYFLDWNPNQKEKERNTEKT